MATKYIVGTIADLQAIADALDHANGLIDDEGNRTPIPARIVIGGVDVTGDPAYDPNAQGNGVVVGTFTVCGVITTDPADPDGPSCLALDDEHPGIVPHLGTTLDDVTIPAEADLVLPADLPPNLYAILYPPPPPFPFPPPTGDPAEASVSIKVDVQMRDDDGDGTPEPHIEVSAAPTSPSVASRLLGKLTSKKKK